MGLLRIKETNNNTNYFKGIVVMGFLILLD